MPAQLQSTLRCLIVADHPVVRQGIRALLERELDGVVVTDAPTPEAALDGATGEPPDVVIIDPRSAGGEVEETVATLRRRLQSAIVVFTSNGGARLLAEALQAAVRACLALYIAASTRSSSSSASEPSWGQEATPTETLSGLPVGFSTASTEAATRSATTRARAEVWCGSRRQNSSPPIRTGVSTLRSCSPSAVATLTSVRSPATFPYASFIRLRPSMSISSTANGWP